ncbi:hypothetical protein GCK32_000968 [Trichostrongylus colubriformis]|uniref:Uncharacterized protein n=1 Tax=Trichostrongylus colubriformis TaxID=6319 RepID=A0AAN8F7K3_TRICO
MKWTYLHFLFYMSLIKEEEGKLTRVFIPANELSLNPLRLLNRTGQVFDINNHSDIQIQITVHPGRCKRKSEHVIIITFLDRWCPPDLLQHLQLLNNAIVLRKDDPPRKDESTTTVSTSTISSNINESESINATELPTLTIKPPKRIEYLRYKLFTTDSSKPLQDKMNNEGKLQVPEGDSVNFSENSGLLTLTLRKPSSTLDITYGHAAEEEDGTEENSRAMSFTVKTKNTRYFLVSATNMSACPTYISKISKELDYWTRESPIPSKKARVQRRERITVLRDVIIACIVVLCYYYFLNYVILPLYFHASMPLPEAVMRQNQLQQPEAEMGNPFEPEQTPDAGAVHIKEVTPPANFNEQ